MSKKAKIILAVLLSVFTVFSAAAATGIIVCKKIYKKNYYPVD